MKIALLHPNNDPRYENLSLGYGSKSRLPETWAAILDAYLREYSKSKHEMLVLDPNRSNTDLAETASEYDFLGMSDWYSNHWNCTDIAKRAKQKNPNIKIVLGGPNATLTAPQTLANHPYVNYIVSRDGEEAFVKLLDEVEIEPIPNLWFRLKGLLKRTSVSQRVDLNKIPLWDFRNFENLDNRLKDYLAAVQTKGHDPWKVPPLSVFGFRGCTKAMKKGACNFCYEDNTGKALAPEKLWEQIAHLDSLYVPGVRKIVYMGDDIFTISPKRIRDIAQSKPRSLQIGIRAYSYLPDLARLQQSELEEMARTLNEIGVFNLFFGSENYNPLVLRLMNKEGVSIEESKRVIKTLYEFGGVGTTMAYMLGYSGESPESLQQNLESLNEFVSLGEALERLYISKAIPFKGTPWCEELENNPGVLRGYYQRTGKNLKEEDYPDYSILSDLVLKHTTTVSKEEVVSFIQKMKEAVGDIPKGGFLLEDGN